MAEADYRGDEAAGDPGDNVGTGQVEQVVVAALVAAKREVTAIVGFGQLLGLDQRAVGAVLDEDAPRGGFADGGRDTHARTPSKWQMA